MSEENLISKILSGKNVVGVVDITEKIDSNVTPNYRKKFDYKEFVKLMLNEKFKIKVLKNIINSKVKRNITSQDPTAKLPVFVYKKKIPELDKYFIFYWKNENDYDYFLLPLISFNNIEQIMNVLGSDLKEKTKLYDYYITWFENIFYVDNKKNYPSMTFKDETNVDQSISFDDIFKHLIDDRKKLYKENKVDEWNRRIISNPLLKEYLTLLKNTNETHFNPIKKYIDSANTLYKILSGQRITSSGGTTNVSFLFLTKGILKNTDFLLCDKDSIDSAEQEKIKIILKDNSKFRDILDKNYSNISSQKLISNKKFNSEDINVATSSSSSLRGNSQNRNMLDMLLPPPPPPLPPDFFD